MSDLLAAIEASALAEYLRVSRWTYPLVNAGHILGIALLVGAVVPMDLRILGAMRGPSVAAVIAFLRPVALAGGVLAVTCGSLMFTVQATDYAASPWFRAKMALLALAVANAALHANLAPLSLPRQRRVALLSIVLWPAVLVTGRMIGYG